MPKPTIAALNGVAFGGGLELALACDLRVIAPHAKVGLTETSLAIIPGAGGTQRLTRIVGEAKAKELILLARRIDATEALTLGLVSRIAAESESVLDHALGLAEPLAAGAPIALAAALDAIDAAADLPLEAGLSYERVCYERTLASEDRLEALAAFAAKRPPRYRGK
jgi:enoyl-CoA hydratase/carnithine racemase